MTISYVWQGISPVVISVVALFIGFFIFSKFYIRKRRRPNGKKSRVKAYGFFFFVFAVFYLVVVVASGIIITNPNMALVVLLSVLTLALVYFDGRITEKVVGRGLAVEANPIMALFFRWVGIRKVRIAVFMVVFAMIAHMVYAGDLLSISVLCLLWIVVDSNNILVLRGRMQNIRLRADTVGAELGFEDLHEL